MKKIKIHKIIYLLWLIVFVIIPISLVVIQSFLDINGQFTFNNYQTFFSPVYLKMTFNSVFYALLITISCLVLAYPLAFFISKVKYSEIWLILFLAPSWINLLLKTYAFISILGVNGIISKISELLTKQNLDLLYTIPGFLIVGVYIFLPFTILPLVNGIKDINKNIIKAGYDLGANSWDVFIHIYLPLTKHAILSAMQIVFIPALSIFMITRLIAGNRIITLGTAIEQHFLTTGNWGLGSVIGTILIVILALSIIFANSKFKFKKLFQIKRSKNA